MRKVKQHGCSFSAFLQVEGRALFETRTWCAVSLTFYRMIQFTNVLHFPQNIPVNRLIEQVMDLAAVIGLS